MYQHKLNHPQFFRITNFGKIRPKFLPIMHFSQASYEFVQKSQILQVFYSIGHFLQESHNIFEKFVSICKKFLQNCDVLFRPKINSRFSGPLLCLF